MAWRDTVKLYMGYSLILGDTPDNVTEKDFKPNIPEISNIHVDDFGLFSGPNSGNKYFPDAKPEDAKPDDKDFIFPMYRALSEVIVHKSWNPIDFSMNNTLRKSLGLLRGVSVSTNHEKDVESAIGAVKETFWEDSYKTENGITVPAGINSQLKIDFKSNPRLCRGINMDPPSVHSTSVSVTFEWEKSHSSLPDDQFWAKLGTYDKDAQLIRRIASKVVCYNELSLVSHGADPFAQKIGKKGEIVNPRYAVANNTELSEMRKTSKIFIFNNKVELSEPDEIPTTPQDSNNNDINSNSPVMNKTFLITLAAILGLVDITEEKLSTDTEVGAAEKAISDKLIELKNANATQATQIQNLTTENTNLKGKEPDKELKDFREARLAEKRAHVTSLLNKLHDNKPVEALLNLVNQSNFEALNALEIDYNTQLEKKFPAKCADCNSTNITRASTATNTKEKEEEKPGSEGQGQKDLGHDKTVEKLRINKRPTNLLMPGFEEAKETAK